MHQERLFFKLVLCLVVAITLFQGEQFINHKSAYAYSCGTYSDVSTRCYAENFFFEHLSGDQTDMDIWRMTCNADCASNGFIAQDMWLVQGVNSACQFNRCWVEAGYINTIGTLSSYFWADNRTNGTYNLHFGATVSPNDYTYGILHEQIFQTGSTTFKVVRSIYFCSSCTTFTDVNSTNNGMVPSTMQVGTELAGVGTGASAQSTHFKTNYWRDSTGHWRPRGAGYATITNSPPFGYWNIVPSSSSTGDWVTSCC